MHPYLRRRDGTELKEKQPKEISQVLDRDSRGVPIFQEQVIQLSDGSCWHFSAGEADAVRRAMVTSENRARSVALSRENC